MRHGISIALQTFRECLRQPIYLSILLSSLFLIGIQPIISLFVFSQHLKLVTDGSLAIILVAGCCVAVICAGYTVSSEIENGAVLLLLSKPVRPSAFIFWKIIGIQAVLLMFVWITGIAGIFAIDMSGDEFEIDRQQMLIFSFCICIACMIGGGYNYFTRASFSSGTSLALCAIFTITLGLKFTVIDSAIDPYFQNLISAMVLVLFAILIVGAMATAFAMRFTLLINMILCGGIFFAGLISDYIYSALARIDAEQIAIFLELPSLRNENWICSIITHVIYGIIHLTAVISHSVIPNWQLLWMTDALAASREISHSYLVAASIYSLSYCAVFYLIASILFQNREIGNQRIS